ncbi:cell division protein FtsL [uncultured Paracoccus sp.]|uniref:cell division protein FtsL n=1 Tax=uncultured Paracoccus sp. TaxID=189685 RepID=UPI0025D11A1A|nr:cell division protein FtsL [uncultured Paracoccus sp.]
MRSVLYLATALCVMGLAFWAYRENYRTQSAINEMAQVQRQIAGLREELSDLRAEWAYLNRPERLKELVDLNFDRLLLVPLNSGQFVDIGHVAYPEPEPEPEPDDAPTEEPQP